MGFLQKKPGRLLSISWPYPLLPASSPIYLILFGQTAFETSYWIGSSEENVEVLFDGISATFSQKLKAFFENN